MSRNISIKEALGMATKTLVSNKLRSSLTMLGIIIGNASVITLVGLGRGAQTLAKNQLSNLGANVLFIVPGNNDTRRRGISIGEIGVTGKARIIKNNLDISLICPGEILFVPKELMKNIPLSKNIAGIVTDQNVNDVYALFNKNNKKISTICNLENMDNHQINNGDLITLQLNEGVIYMGQIEDDDAIDKYKYV